MNKIHDFQSTIMTKKMVTDDIFSLELEIPEENFIAQPGQFVQVSYEGQPSLLSRPLSIAGVTNNSLFLLIKIRGAFTRRLYESKEKFIRVLGPLGNFFPHPETRKLNLIGGGIGIAPLLFAYRYYCSSKAVSIYYGVKKKSDKYLFSQLKDNPSCACNIVCEEEEGLVTDYLKKNQNFDEDVTCFICGPAKMMAKTAEILYNFNNTYYSLEVMMGCGLGICLGCSLPMAGGNRRVCYDGPVFKGSEILWKEYISC